MQTLTSGNNRSHSLQVDTLPVSLQPFTLGQDLHQSVQDVKLLCNMRTSLQTSTVSSFFNQSLQDITLPGSLQALASTSVYKVSSRRAVCRH